jgi:hypothetical protein
LAFLIVVNQLVFDANQTQPRRLNGGAFVVALIAFLAFMGSGVRLIVRFARKTT